MTIDEKVLDLEVDVEPWETTLIKELHAKPSFIGHMAVNIPDELKKLNQWVLADDRKVPRQLNNHPASVSNPSHWSSFEASLVAAEWSVPRIGFVFTENDPYVGIDLDNCRNPDTGRIDEWAEKLIVSFLSYSEISISGTGIHIIIKGALPNGRGRKFQPEQIGKMVSCQVPEVARLEMYDRGRYFVMTGVILSEPSEGRIGFYPEFRIVDRQDELDKLFQCL